MRFVKLLLLVLIISSLNSQIKIDSIKIKGLNYLTENELLILFEKKNHDSFEVNDITKYNQTILDYCEENGFPFAKVKLDKIEIDSVNKKVNLFFKIDEGYKIFIKEISFVGNKKTTNKFLNKIGINIINSKYSQNSIEKYRQILNEKYLFSSISNPEIYILNVDEINNTSDVGLHFNVVENKYNSLDGILGFVPNENNKNYFSGFINYKNLNLFGTGRKINLNWQQIENISKEIFIEYYEPWIMNYPIDCEFNILQRNQNEEFNKFNYGISISSNYFPPFKVAYQLNKEEIYPNLNESFGKVFRSSSILNGVKIEYDYFANNKNIFHFSSSVIDKNKNIDGENIPKNILKKVNQKISKLSMKYNNYNFKFYYNFQEVWSNQFETSDYYFFGGAITFRGFKENQFLITMNSVLQSEYHLNIDSENSVFSFFDYGILETKKSINVNNETKIYSLYGYGIGLNIDFNFGKIILALALAKNETFSEAKIHLNYKNEF